MYIIGITGGTASGKTTIVNQIITELSDDNITVISQDSYYKDTRHLTKKERANINFDHPDAIDFSLLNQHLKKLKKGNTIKQPIYSFTEHNRINKTQTTKPKKVIIVEGILIFNNPELRTLFDLKIFIETDTDVRLIRRIKRDMNERGRDLNEVLTRYQNTLKPMHQQFILKTKEYADIILPNNQNNTVGVSIVKSIIKEQII